MRFEKPCRTTFETRREVDCEEPLVVLRAGATAATIANAVAQSTTGAKPLPMTGYKLDLLKGLVRELFEGIAA